MPTSDERLRSVEELRDLLISRARGGLIDDGRFRDLRNMVLGDPDLAARAPDWLRRTRTPDLWWAHIKPLYPTYAARTRYVHDEFEPLIEFLENPERAVTPKTHLLFRKVIRPPVTHGVGAPGAPITSHAPEPAKPRGRVFIVHGHDLTLKDAVARFVERLGLEAVVLSEQPNAGRTIIEKFEAHANVDFAIVLMTPDDTGSVNGGRVKPRARQNVILELGFFIGRLGRRNVLALVVPRVERPSDIDGVLYVSLDTKGAWQARVAKELQHAGLPVDLNLL